MISDIPELTRGLYFSLRDFNSKLNNSYPRARVDFDLTTREADIYKDKKHIKTFDFGNITANEWPAKERDLWNFLIDFILELSAERMTGREPEAEINEEIPF